MKKYRILSAILAVLMVVAICPVTVFAADEHEGMVRVIISNDTFLEETDDSNGAPSWTGTLVDEWVEINGDSTMMSCVVTALENNGYEQSGAENNYISTINGLSEFDGGLMSGWMGTLNDWFTNYGFGDFTVAAGNFGAGDEIHIMYTCAYGDDLGGSWGNTDTRIDSIVFGAGALDKNFDPDYSAESGVYTLTLPAGTTAVNVKPTAANKNYMARIFLNDFEEAADTHYGGYEFKRNDEIPVKNGDIIYIGCGFPNWPSMNESDGGYKYAFKVAIPEAEQEVTYKTVLNNTLAQLAVTVKEPTFGTGGGEWSVLSLARGGYFAVDDPYFDTYYSNVEKIVPDLAETATGKGVKKGGLDKNKSTENSRLILALAAIGKDPTNVGGVNVLGAYDTNGFTWIKKQGINGPIFTLIALDTREYPTADSTLRQQCVDFILSKELDGGGWALSGTAADPDITSMALQALVKYKDQKEVAAAADRAFTALSNMQKDNGGFASWGSVNSESIAQVITALSAWGIDADKDSRFVKENGSALDALLTFYVPEGKGFAHVLTSGGGYTGGEVNGMATDQASYALVAYDRFIFGKTSLYDMTDVGATYVTPTVTGKTATVSLPADTAVEKNKPLNFRAVSGTEVDKAEITIPAAVMEKIGDAEKMELRIDLGTIVFDKGALAQMQSASDVKIFMASEENDNGSTTFTLTAVDKGGANVFSSGNDGYASISVKFKAPADGKQINVYYVNGETRTPVPSKYENGKLIFTVEHFSEYEAVEEDIISATLSLPEKIGNIVGSEFNAVVNLNGFPKDCRLMDSVISIPAGIRVTNVTVGSRISGGEISWNYEETSGKLRVVYLDINEGKVMQDSGTTFPLELLTISFVVDKALDTDSISVSIDSLSFMQNSESETVKAVDISSATDEAGLTDISFSVKKVYTGDDVDLISSDLTAIAVSVIGIEKGSKLVYDDGVDQIELKYNDAVTKKTGIATYLAFIASDKSTDGFENEANYSVTADDSEEVVFGDINGDGVINAQDALNALNFWLRKSVPEEDQLLAANVNADSRINTLDVLAIVEYYVDGKEFAIINYIATNKNDD